LYSVKKSGSVAKNQNMG